MVKRRAVKPSVGFKFFQEVMCVLWLCGVDFFGGRLFLWVLDFQWNRAKRSRHIPIPEWGGAQHFQWMD